MASKHEAFFELTDAGSGADGRVRVWADGNALFVEPCQDVDTDDPIWPEPVVAVERFDGQWRASVIGDIDNDRGDVGDIVINLCESSS